MKIDQLEAIERRLKESHEDYQYWSERQKLTAAGIAGENAVCYYLQELTVPHLLFRNFFIKGHSNHTHEIDFILLFPNLIICLEVKNITGTLDFDDEASQLLRTRADGSVERFQNPCEQLLRHIRLLSSFFPNTPIEGAIVVANRNAIIGKRKSRIPIFHADHLTSFIEQQLEQYKQFTINKEAIHSTLMHKKLSNSLNVNFKLHQLKLGVLCPMCHFSYKMIFVSGSFICVNCRFKDKYAYLYAIKDYRLLVNDKISNEQFRLLCEIESRHAARRLLSILTIFKEGRYTYYEIPEQILSKHPDQSNNSIAGC